MFASVICIVAVMISANHSIAQTDPYVREMMERQQEEQEEKNRCARANGVWKNGVLSGPHCDYNNRGAQDSADRQPKSFMKSVGISNECRQPIHVILSVFGKNGIYKTYTYDVEASGGANLYKSGTTKNDGKGGDLLHDSRKMIYVAVLSAYNAGVDFEFSGENLIPFYAGINKKNVNINSMKKTISLVGFKPEADNFARTKSPTADMDLKNSEQVQVLKGIFTRTGERFTKINFICARADRYNNYSGAVSQKSHHNDRVRDYPTNFSYDVADAQRKLKFLGYNPGRIDGALGPNTRKAIAEWQGNAGFRPTGIIKSEEYSQLTIDYSGAQSAHRADRRKEEGNLSSRETNSRENHSAKTSDKCERDSMGKVITEKSLGCDLKGLTEALSDVKIKFNFNLD